MIYFRFKLRPKLNCAKKTQFSFINFHPPLHQTIYIQINYRMEMGKIGNLNLDFLTFILKLWARIEAILVCENWRKKFFFVFLRPTAKRPENWLQGRNYWSHHLIKFHAINKPYLSRDTRRKTPTTDNDDTINHCFDCVEVFFRLLWHHFSVLNPLSRARSWNHVAWFA